MPRQGNDGSVPSDRRPPVSLPKSMDFPDMGQGFWDWEQVAPTRQARLNAVAGKAGDAVSWAVNRAQTAGSITILHGGERPRYYANSYDDAERIIEGLIEAYGG